MKLLQVPTALLEERIKEELEENPALETGEEEDVEEFENDPTEEFEKKEDEFDWNAHIKFMHDFKPFWTEADDEALKKTRKADIERFKNLNW